MRNLLITEGVMCAYRNYYSYSKIGRVLVLIRVSTELLLISAHVISFTRAIMEISMSFNLNFYLDMTTYIACVTLPLYNSKKNDRFVKMLNANFQYFLNDVVYIEKIERRKNKLSIEMIVLLLFKVIAFITAFDTKLLSPGVPRIGFYLFQIHIIYGDLRYITQYLSYCWMLDMIAEQVKCIIREIVKETRTTEVIRNIPDGRSQPNTGNPRVHINQIDKWSTVYINIADGSNLCNSIYGIQVYNIKICIEYIEYICLNTQHAYNKFRIRDTIQIEVSIQIQ